MTPFLRAAASIAIGLTVVASVFAAEPSLIDSHVHFRGELEFLEQYTQRLERANGLACLLVTPDALEKARTFMAAHPGRFIGYGDVKLDAPDALAQVIASMPPDSEASANCRTPSVPSTIRSISQSIPGRKNME